MSFKCSIWPASETPWFWIHSQIYANMSHDNGHEYQVVSNIDTGMQNGKKSVTEYNAEITIWLQDIG